VVEALLICNNDLIKSMRLIADFVSDQFHTSLKQFYHKMSFLSKCHVIILEATVRKEVTCVILTFLQK